MELGEMPDFGLCSSLPKEYEKTFKFLHPTVEDTVLLVEEVGGCAAMYWGHGIKGAVNISLYFEYTPLRQSLVLLLAEMIEDPFFIEKTK